jgi:hypothetical protein
VPLVPGLGARLAAGVRVADVGCGTGHAMVLLAGAYPAAVLARIHAALAPGGTFVMVEPRASSDLAGNLANPQAPMLYSVSTLRCLTVSLAGGGAGLGAAWGEELALAMLAEAGFGDVVVHDAPGDPLNGVFVAAKAGT